MLTKELLEKTKSLLLEKGWGQGLSFKRETLCLAEALAKANPCFSHDEEEGLEVYRKARSLIVSEIDGSSCYDASTIVYWNDVPGRTLEAVIAVLDKAIEKC